jgi:hypothetical protein
MGCRRGEIKFRLENTPVPTRLQQNRSQGLVSSSIKSVLRNAAALGERVNAAISVAEREP